MSCHELMDKKINLGSERQADKQKKSDDTARNNQNQQPNKRQNTEELCRREMVPGGDHTEGFDVIIGMDWLAKYHAVIVCAKKIVRIPFGDETLIVRGRRDSSNEHGTRLNIISCTKAQEYLTKGCHVFLANITATKTRQVIGEETLEDVPVVQEFPKVFPEDLSGIPPTRQVEFRIDLVPGATLLRYKPDFSNSSSHTIVITTTFYFSTQYCKT
ncbi:putative reverse transcriptase domain-containing protein [Tanacetum coccineum]